MSEAPRACGRLLIFSVVKVKKKGSCDNNGYLLLLGLKEKITGTIFLAQFLVLYTKNTSLMTNFTLMFLEFCANTIRKF